MADGWNAAALVTAPRGFRLALEVVLGVHPPMLVALCHASRQPEDASVRAALVRVIGEVDTAAIAQWRDPLQFAEPVGMSVDRAMYWQPPDEEDLLRRYPAIREALLPIAEAIIAAPGTRWWTSPLERSTQRYTVRYEDDERPTPPPRAAARDVLLEWSAETARNVERSRRDQRADARACASGQWWSTPDVWTMPDHGRLLETTRSLPRLGSLKLIWEEDSFGARLAQLWPVTPKPGARVFEIAASQDWAELVRRYPLDVTAARRHDWFAVTERDGRWLIPDWLRVADDFDAVHLTVAGYLTGATGAIAVDDSAATVLAGWAPDTTWWLTDQAQVEAVEPERWRNPVSETGPDLDWRRTG